MKLYVAGASSAWRESQELIFRLVAQGYQVTFDWTQIFQDPDAVEAANPATAAQDCLNGVRSADALVVLAEPGRVSTGLWAELGYALGTGKPICCYIPKFPLSEKQQKWVRQQVFLFSPRVARVYRFRDLLQWLTLSSIHWKELLVKNSSGEPSEPHGQYTQRASAALEVLFQDSSVTWPTTVETLRGIHSGLEQMIDVGTQMALCEVAA